MKRTILLGGAAISLIALLGAGCVKNTAPNASDEERGLNNPTPSAEETTKNEEKNETTSTDTEKEESEETTEKNDTGLTQKDMDELKSDLQSMQADDLSELSN